MSRQSTRFWWRLVTHCPGRDTRVGGVWAFPPPSVSPVFSAGEGGASPHSMTAYPLPRNVDPPVWYDTDVKLFEIQRV